MNFYLIDTNSWAVEFPLYHHRHVEHGTVLVGTVGKGTWLQYVCPAGDAVFASTWGMHYVAAMAPLSLSLQDGDVYDVVLQAENAIPEPTIKLLPSKRPATGVTEEQAARLRRRILNPPHIRFAEHPDGDRRRRPGEAGNDRFYLSNNGAKVLKPDQMYYTLAEAQSVVPFETKVVTLATRAAK